MAITTREGKTQTVLAEINMVPFIDVVLVLLIIFMITAPVIQSGLVVDVPTTEKVNELTESLQVVTIDRSQKLYLQDNEVLIGDLAGRIKEKAPEPKDRVVYLQADKSVPWEIPVRVIDELHQAGIEKISIVTQLFEGKRK
jgi:biopolymer transport protein ExbD/biopolymer transport protein TolR